MPEDRSVSHVDEILQRASALFARRYEVEGVVLLGMRHPAARYAKIGWLKQPEGWRLMVFGDTPAAPLEDILNTAPNVRQAALKVLLDLEAELRAAEKELDPGASLDRILSDATTCLDAVQGRRR